MGKIRQMICLSGFALVLGVLPIQAGETNDLGVVYKLTAQAAAEMQTGQFDKAIVDINKTIELCPTNCFAYLNRAVAYSAKGDHEKSIADYDKFIAMNSTNGFAFVGRANEYAKLEKYEKAAADLDKGINLDSQNVHALALRGFCCEKLGRYAEAGNDYSNAVQLDFNFADGWNSLAWLRASCPRAEVRNGHEAVAAAIKACNLTDWKSWMYLDTLAVAYAETGDFELAVKYERGALQIIDPKNKEIDGMNKRLSMFQKKQPYRDDASSGD